MPFFFIVRIPWVEISIFMYLFISETKILFFWRFKCFRTFPVGLNWVARVLLEYPPPLIEPFFVIAHVFIFVFRLSVNNEKKIIERELLEENMLGLIPKEHIKILSSHLRFRSGWIDERIRKLYSRFAIRLAFNKNLFKKAKDLNKLYYSSEIEKNREAVKSLLSNNFISV